MHTTRNQPGSTKSGPTCLTTTPFKEASLPCARVCMCACVWFVIVVHGACVRACVRAVVRACVRACVHACVRVRACVRACVRAWGAQSGQPRELPFSASVESHLCWFCSSARRGCRTRGCAPGAPGLLCCCTFISRRQGTRAPLCCDPVTFYPFLPRNRAALGKATEVLEELRKRCQVCILAAASSFARREANAPWGPRLAAWRPSWRRQAAVMSPPPPTPTPPPRGGAAICCGAVAQWGATPLTRRP